MSEISRCTVRFSFKWLLLCALGFTAGLAGAFVSAKPIEAVVGVMLATPIMFLIAGSAYGAAQGLAMSRELRASLLWVGASAVGLGVGMTAGVVLIELVGRAITGEQLRLPTVHPLERIFGLALMGCVAGLAVGVAQGLALRAFGVLRRWTFLCGLSFGIGFPVGGVTADLLFGGLASATGFGAMLMVTGLTVGALTSRTASRLQAARPTH